MKKLIFLLVISQSWYSHATPIVRKSKNLKKPFDIAFVADNQINNHLASSGPLRDLAADNVISVALRPPVLDLFSTDLFRVFLQDAGNKYIVHLGDALNIACDFEFERFKNMLQIKQNSPYRYKGVVMLPGNHDHIYIGNSAGSGILKKSPFRKAWAKSCNLESYPFKVPKDISRDIMHKTKFVNKYLDLLYLQSRIPKFRQDFPISKSGFSCSVTNKKSRQQFFEKKTNMRFCEWKSKSDKSFLRRVYYEVPTNNDIRVSYRAKLLQMINMKSKIKNIKYLGIMLDSTDYLKPPSFGGTLVGGRNLISGTINPGLYGSFSKYQMAIVEKWIKNEKEAAKKDPSIKHLVFVLMTHHPAVHFFGDNQKFIRKILLENPNSFLINAHTHMGFLFKQLKGLEANVGSTTDYPPKYSLVNTPVIADKYINNVEAIEVKLYPVKRLMCEGLKPKKTYVSYRTNFTKNLNKKYWELITTYRDMYKFMKVPEDSIIKQLNQVDFSKCKNNKCINEMFVFLKKLYQYDKMNTLILLNC
jgi:hypothetical protein